MIKLLDNTRISRYNYFYMMCMMVYLGFATVFARSLGNIATWGNTFALIITIIFINKNKVKFKKNYIISILVFLLYALVTTINNGILSPFWITQWLIWLTIAYCIVYTFKDKFFVLFETLIYHLSIISFVFWIIDIIAPSTLNSIASVLHFSTAHGGEKSNVAYNLIFYTLGSHEELSDYVFIKRNAGFAWEPGAFASYICMAILCNSFRTDFKIKNNIPLIIFLIALFSTQSTTGTIILLAMVASWLIIKRKFWYALILVPIGIYIFQLPFVQEKLLNEYGNLEIFNLAYMSDDDTYALGRMASFLLDWEEFLRHPILGLGGWTGGTWLAQFGYDNVSTISGIGGMLAMYGAIMTSLFLYLMYKSARLIAKTMSSNGYLMFVAIIGMTISYEMWQHPIYICFWMFGVFYIKDKRGKTKHNLYTPQNFHIKQTHDNQN